MDGNLYTYHVTAGTTTHIRPLPVLMYLRANSRFAVSRRQDRPVVRDPRRGAGADGLRARGHQHEADQGGAPCRHAPPARS